MCVVVTISVTDVVTVIVVMCDLRLFLILIHIPLCSYSYSTVFLCIFHCVPLFSGSSHPLKMPLLFSVKLLRILQ